MHLYDCEARSTESTELSTLRIAIKSQVSCSSSFLATHGLKKKTGNNMHRWQEQIFCIRKSCKLAEIRAPTRYAFEEKQ